MAEKHGKRRGWNIVLALHALLYVVGWIGALYFLSTLNIAYDNFANSTHFIAAVLLWMPLLALHIGIYLYARRWTTPNNERRAYREGYADALRQFADQAYPEHKSVPDENDFVDMPEKRKRSS
jgi:hypothetical protein